MHNHSNQLIKVVIKDYDHIEEWELSTLEKNAIFLDYSSLEQAHKILNAVKKYKNYNTKFIKLITAILKEHKELIEHEKENLTLIIEIYKNLKKMHDTTCLHDIIKQAIENHKIGNDDIFSLLEKETTAEELSNILRNLDKLNIPEHQVNNTFMLIILKNRNLCINEKFIYMQKTTFLNTYKLFVKLNQQNKSSSFLVKLKSYILAIYQIICYKINSKTIIHPENNTVMSKNINAACSNMQENAVDEVDNVQNTKTSNLLQVTNYEI